MNSNKAHLFSYRTIIIIVVILSLSGCGLYAPISESAVFDENIPVTDSFRSVMESSRKRSSVTNSFYTKTFVSKTLATAPEIYDFSLNKLWHLGISGYSFLIKPGKRLTIGISPGLIINGGVDFTYNFGSDFYLTGIANASLSTEIILQNKILNGRSIKGSLGISFRREKQEIRNSFWNPYKGILFHSSMLGVRWITNFNIWDAKARLISALYYESKYKTPVINVGLAFDRY